MGTEEKTRPKTVVLIHGLWMTPLSFEHWIARYEGRGYQVIAEPWPRMNRPIEELRRDPSVLAGLGLNEIVDHYDRIVGRLDPQPIIIGHSFGGLVTQLLLDRGLGVAGVAIGSAPVKGVIKLPWSTLRVSFPALSNPANLRRAVSLTPKQFHYAFTNNLSERESREVYDRYQVPGPDRVVFQAAFANFAPAAATRINFANDHRAPLLLVAGSADHISPVSVSRSIAKLYRKSRAVTELMEFSGRSHYILGEEGWEKVADYCLNWAETPPTASMRAA
jgi:alpha-beta hydrolase superfamily lysophospholipase